MRNWTILRYFCAFYILTHVKSGADEELRPISCGGFIKAETDLHVALNLITVKLFTLDGHKKGSSIVAPINGYYMIPVYGKGQYKLIVEAPFGWEFEPESVELNVDFVSDPCSTGKDINFRFKGYSVVGKVCLGDEKLGCKQNLRDFEVGLFKKADNSNPILRTRTDNDGKYIFRGVSFGSYFVKHVDPLVCVPENQAITVTVSGASNPETKDMIIVGFTVAGFVKNQGQSVATAVVYLFSKENSKIKVKNCETASLPLNMQIKGMVNICSTETDSSGKYSFSCVPPNNYVLSAYYESDGVKFDLMPLSIDIQILDRSFISEKNFEIKGFSLVGRVLWSKNGIPAQGASVIFDDQSEIISSTDAQGLYHLKGVSPGRHQIRVSLDNVEFDTLSIDLSIKSHKIPDIHPSRYKLSGSVKIDQKILNQRQKLAILQKRKLLLIAARRSSSDPDKKSDNKENDVISIQTDEHGHFDLLVKPGLYTLEPQVLTSERELGFSIVPKHLNVEISNKPLLNVQFSQFEAKIVGSIKCLDICKDMRLNLYSSNELLKSIDMPLIQTEQKFTFDRLLNGKYEIKIDGGDYCWQSRDRKVTINDADVADNVNFMQNGYRVAVSISHEAKLVFYLSQNKAVTGDINLNKGTNEFCLPVNGLYEFKIDSCHKFNITGDQGATTISENFYKFDTNRPKPIVLTAVQHVIMGKIDTDQPVNDILIIVKSLSIDDVQTPIEIGPLKTTSLSRDPKKRQQPISDEHSKEQEPIKKQPSTYAFEFYANQDEDVLLTPKSATYLFEPERRTISVKDECITGVSFTGQHGQFLHASVEPPLEGVEIVMTHQMDSLHQYVAYTDGQGFYSIGPLKSLQGFDISANKPGYVFSTVSGKLGHFNAYKLSELTLKAIDSEQNGLSGVLLSLSGKNYRSNNITGDDGVITFVGLSPGDYFVKPVLKEYNFEPETQIVQIQEGSTLSVELLGKRVAYSCSGVVRHLAGQPVADVGVEAFSVTCPDQPHEEAVTGDDGYFKLRGLQPGCEYVLQVKPGQSSVPPTIPNKHMIKVNKANILDKDLILKPDVTTMEIAGRVDCDRQLLPFLKVVVYKENAPETPVNTVTFHMASVFFLPAFPIDDTVYLVKLENSLSPSKYTGLEQPEIQVKANKSFYHVEFHFRPKKKPTEQEIIRSGYLAFPIIILIMLLTYNYEKILPFLREYSHISTAFFNRSNSHLLKIVKQYTENAGNASAAMNKDDPGGLLGATLSGTGPNNGASNLDSDSITTFGPGGSGLGKRKKNLRKT